MAERDGATVDVDGLGREAKLPDAGDGLAGKGFVQFDHIQLAGLDAGAVERLQRRADRANAMISGSQPHTAMLLMAARMSRPLRLA